MCLITSANPYVFDFDKNRGLALTEKNVALMNAIINNDSNYRAAIDASNPKSSAYSISKLSLSNVPHPFNDIYEIVKRIDKENSTHLSATNGHGNGITITAKYISGLNNLKRRLEAGDATLVNDISSAVAGRNIFSFASKFCTYMAYNSFASPTKKDAFSIYDSVLKSALPYYVWSYLGTGVTAKSIENYASRRNYQAYRDLIDGIIAKNRLLTGYTITRRDFDHLLWYYYKGDKGRISQNNSFIKNNSAIL